MLGGAPNITGSVEGSKEVRLKGESGAFYCSNSFKDGLAADTLGSSNHTFHIDASRSNQVFGSSVTVQPPSVLILPCIKV